MLMGIDIRFCSKQGERERERTKKGQLNTVEQYFRQWAHVLQASSFSFLDSSPACVMPGRSYGDMEPRDYVLTSPGLNLRVPDVAVKCVPATAGSKVS